MADCCSIPLVLHIKGVPTGNVADFSSFPFHAVKDFTTAEGGCATWRHIDGIDDETIYKRIPICYLCIVKIRMLLQKQKQVLRDMILKGYLL